MSYTVSDLESDITSILKGTTVDKVSNLYPLINRAARDFLLDVDPAETVRIAELSQPIYGEVYDYSAPTDLKGNKIIDIYPSVNRNSKFMRRGREQFDYDVEDATFTIRNNSGTKSIRLAKAEGDSSILTSCNSLTADGTWAATAGATNLTLDELYYVNGGGSLNFDLSAGSATGYLDITLDNAVDLTDYEDIGAIFAWVYIPDTTKITSFTMTWGSDNANYWEDSATAAVDGAFRNGWNLIRFDWNGATKTLAPTVSAIDYLKFLVTYDSTAETDLRLGGLVARCGTIYNIEYYSKYLFTDGTTSAWKEEAEAGEDTINLDTDSYSIYFNKVAEYICQNVRTMSGDSEYYRKQYENLRDIYINDNKSEAKKKTTPYYKLFHR